MPESKSKLRQKASQLRLRSLDDGCFVIASTLATSSVIKVHIDFNKGVARCNSTLNIEKVSLSCPEKYLIEEILFASYGTPGGGCGQHFISSCHSQNSSQIVERECLGKKDCVVDTSTQFGDPCFGTVKYLVIDYFCVAEHSKYGSSFAREALEEEIVYERRFASTIPTYQIVANPELRRGRKMHDSSFLAAHDINATLVRYAPWDPYAPLMVGELTLPTENQTFWNFTYMSPIFEDALNSILFDSQGNIKNKSPLMCFCNTAPWLWEGGVNVDINTTNPDQRNFINYHGNNKLRDSTGKQVGDYFRRMAEYYIKGEFIDEIGDRHTSPYNYPITHWEVMNEINGMDKETYTLIYDETVISIRKSFPSMHFMGLALMQETRDKMQSWFEFFLQDKNHKEEALPLDFVSFHYYNFLPNNAPWDSVFVNADVEFNDIVQMALNQRSLYAPHVKFDMNEVGCMGPDSDESRVVCAAWWSYMFGTATKLGIEAIGASQLVGYPAMEGFDGEYPDVSMMDYDSLKPTAKYHGLKLIVDHFGSNLESLTKPYEMFYTSSEQPQILFAQAYFSNLLDRYIILLVNKSIEPIIVNVPKSSNKKLSFVDLTTNFDHYQTITLGDSDDVLLNGFSTSIIIF